MMGWKYEVLAYTLIFQHGLGEPAYKYVQVYTGNSLIQAVKAMRHARKHLDAGCVRLEWR
jgi:hypothetical protein